MRCLLFSIGVLAFAGCIRSDADEAPIGAATTTASTPAAPGSGSLAPAVLGDPTSVVDAPRYSPFAIRLDGHQTFDVVTFKDVSQRANDPALQVDELMAEAFSLALRESHPGVLTEVVYEAGLLDPGNHVFCDRRHLYVDFWRTSASGKWGYSLWSGCGEDDRFAWSEVDGPAAYGLAEQIEVVVEAISRRLAVADRSACHRRQC